MAPRLIFVAALLCLASAVDRDLAERQALKKEILGLVPSCEEMCQKTNTYFAEGSPVRDPACRACITPETEAEGAGDPTGETCYDKHCSSLALARGAGGCPNTGFTECVAAKAPGLLEARMEDGAHALHCAADGGFEEIVRELLTFNGQDYLASPPKDEDLNTPLHLAASMGHLEDVNVICELVPDKLATLKMQNDVGETPLMCASSRGHEKVVNLIVQQKEIGELLNQQDASGCKAADKARAGGRASVLRILKDAEEETK